MCGRATYKESGNHCQTGKVYANMLWDLAGDRLLADRAPEEATFSLEDDVPGDDSSDEHDHDLDELLW